MTAHHYELGPGASLLDRITLRLFRWWRGAGRDFLLACFLTQLVVAAMLVIPLAAVPGDGNWQAVGALAALVAPVAAWMVHRRRHDWRVPPANPRARRWGIGLGVALFLVTGLFLMVLLSYIGIVISMLSAQGPLALLPALGSGAVGWLAAVYRKRQLDNPIYP